MKFISTCAIGVGRFVSFLALQNLSSSYRVSGIVLANEEMCFSK
jgi:hypothetical protein